MKGKKSMVIKALLLIAVIALVLIWLFYMRWNLPFEEVGSFDTGRELTHNESTVWFSLRHERYFGFHSIELLETFGLDYTDLSIPFDFDNYTYIFTIGHELRSIQYSYSVFKNRQFIIFPRDLIGIADLDENLENKVFVYRIRRQEIGSDLKNPRAHVTFS